MVCGRESVLVTPFVHVFFFLLLVRGGIFGVPRDIDRDRMTTSTDRYGSAYSCTASSGGHLYRRMRTGVPQVAGATRRVPYRFLPHAWFPRNGTTFTARVALQLLY